MSFLETYRGTVYRWEVDNVDHFTVAYYFSRFEDATAALLDALGLGRGVLLASGRVAAVAECRVRYQRELRVGDVLHIESAVTAAGDAGLGIVHQVFDSGDGARCTTVTQRVAILDAATRAPAALTAEQQAAARSRTVEWEAEADAPTSNWV